ncbi:MAG: alpha/beta fold hydrolase [Chlorobiaceae bacterium]|nr:alpha/beta fold hydrolase [Chlorobiaceae bacterium]
MNNCTTPAWLDRTEYPFESRFFSTPAGNMHFLDEGSGDPVVFIHGNPVWSFVFRNVIASLRNDFRCIAPDHIGFGLSEKPQWWSYLPEDHAGNLELLLESLDLKRITLVVNDWGGPIGLSYALRHPEKIANLVISNTWLWSVETDWYYQAFSGFMGGPVGRWLTGEFGFFVKTFMPLVFGNKSKLTQELHAQYIHPFDNREGRKGMWVFPQQIVGSSPWLDSLWKQIGTLGEKKVLLAWGMKDIAFREHEMNTWLQVFPDALLVRFEDAGHYVAEEKPVELAEAIRSLSGRSSPR